MSKKQAPHKSGPTSYQYSGLVFAQRPHAPRLVIFYAPVGEILLFSQVDMLSSTNTGPQREQKKARVTSVAKFLEADAHNTIPSAVILAFAAGAVELPKKKESGPTEITIKAQSGAATIVDGQHRLYGINKFDSKTPVAVVGLLDTDEVERAFQFLIVNNKSSRVAATHTKALLAKMKSTPLAKRLAAARMAFDSEGIGDVDLVNKDPKSPFHNTIAWTTTPEENRIVQATAIQTSLDFIQTLGITEYEDRDVRRAVFLASWTAIKKEWGKLWIKNSRLISKVGIICLTRVVFGLLASWADNEILNIELSDLDDIGKQTKNIISKMDPRFWTVPWAASAQGGFDTTQGRDRVVAALKRLYRNGKSGEEWYKEIEIIDPSAL